MEQTPSIDEARATLSAAETDWSKSSFSNGGASGCFEFNFTVPGHVGVRDSKLGNASPVLVFTARELDAMLAGARAGEFDGRIV
ncbi:DUF397 domain-containing protein [Pseudonocardia sp. HH130630-07]|uniref:DUF397 domain-containing protein n=1 Tax=Pseudonocardia sp. HH130630-07 TaxID=1690815 RepID=UPI000814C0D2|nr:DUF397 domain-containing protein [Pseudonocardia sp. HH130630-07]ANY07524.1 hypothetical protein AFB00_15860 [Pseudonocardia sp. HH130630-07]